MSNKMLLSEDPKKYPKLISRFEKETGYKAILINGKTTGQFEFWLWQQGLKTSNFAEVNQVISKILKEAQNRPEVKEKHSKSMKKVWHDPKYRKKMKNIQKEVHNRPEAKERQSKAMKGDKNPNYGKFGEESSGWKGDDVGYDALHIRVRNKKPKPENCEICGLPEFYENLGKLELSNIKNHQYTDNPDDYQYVHHSCHMKYDKNLLNK